MPWKISGVLAPVFERMRLFTPSGWSSAYCRARMPPHDCPNRCIRPRSRVRRIVSSSATKRGTTHRDSSSGRSDSPLPSWS
jgi:hypothetical protein